MGLCGNSLVTALSATDPLWTVVDAARLSAWRTLVQAMARRAGAERQACCTIKRSSGRPASVRSRDLSAAPR
jgi:hypothetical protein